MAVNYYRSEQIITMDANTDVIQGEKYPIDWIMVRSTTAGTFTVVIGGATLTFTNSSTVLTLYLPIKRTVTRIATTALPAGGIVTIFLEKKV